MRKRQLFYFSPDANGEYRVREGRVVQARVIAVADKSIRVEIFGVECSIMARDLAWDWIGDAHDRFAVGDQILVRVTEVNKTSQEELSVRADVKSVTENTSREALKRCRVQSKYAGRVTEVHKGIVYVRLSNGVNAVAHSCYDRRTPGSLQFWAMLQKDRANAWEHYMAYTRQGGSRVFTELLKNAGLDSPFEESCLRGVCETAKQWLDSYDLTGIE